MANLKEPKRIFRSCLPGVGLPCHRMKCLIALGKIELERCGILEWRAWPKEAQEEG
jgi:hypothetical protein